MGRRLCQRLGDKKFGTQVSTPAGRVWAFGATETECLANAQAIKEQVRGAKALRIPADRALANIAAAARGPLTVEECWNDYHRSCRGNWKGQALSTWRHRLKPAFGALFVHDLTENALREWAIQQSAEVMVSTVRNAWQLLRSMVRRQLVRLEGKLPWGDFKPPKDPVKKHEKRAWFRSSEDAFAVMAECEQHDRRLILKGQFSDLAARVAGGVLVGLRQGEASGLGWDDLLIDVERPTVLLRYQALDQWDTDETNEYREASLAAGRSVAPCKGQTEDRIRLHPTFVECLKRQREHLRLWGWYSDLGPVFPAVRWGRVLAGFRGTGWRTHADAVRNDVFRCMVERAGIDPARFSFHSSRHTKASLELAAGKTMIEVQEMMRHKSIDTTVGYMHRVNPDGPASAIVLPGVLEGPPLALPPPPEPRRFAEHVATGELPERSGDIGERPPETPRFVPTRRRGRKRSVVSFREAWEAFVLEKASEAAALEACERGRRPPAITEASDQAYERAYQREGGGEPSRKAGRLARRALLAAWKKFLIRLRKEPDAAISRAAKAIVARAEVSEARRTTIRGPGEHAAARRLVDLGRGTIEREESGGQAFVLG